MQIPIYSEGMCYLRLKHKSLQSTQFQESKMDKVTVLA